VLLKALARVSRTEHAVKAPAASGKIVVVVGTRGGVGASSLATNLAWILATERNQRTVLVDLDLQFGTTALSLDLEPGRGLAEALQNAGRIDDFLIDRAAVKINDRLSILSAEEGLDRPIVIDAAAVGALTDRLRTNFETVIVDLPRNQIPVMPTLVAEAETIAVVTDYSLVSARDAPRLVRMLRTYAPSARILLIADRVGAGSAGELRRADFERVLEAKIDIEIPFDRRPANESAQIGKPLAAAGKRSKAALALHQLADVLAGSKADDAPAPFWRRLMGRDG
jgi:pilus assembly protein CpaE